MVALATEWLDETPDKVTKVALLTALLEVTDGKIYVEAERYVARSVSVTGLEQNLTTTTPATTMPIQSYARAHVRARAHVASHARVPLYVPL